MLVKIYQVIIHFIMLKFQTKIDNEILLADSGYGQGEILINPVQILSIYSALENNGNINAPHLLKDTKKSLEEKYYFKENINLLTDGMQQVVNKTHKEDIYRSYANLISKSGTAELKMKQGETGRQIGWFISYDKDNPNMMMAINVKDVQDKGIATMPKSQVKCMMSYMRTVIKIRYR